MHIRQERNYKLTEIYRSVPGDHGHHFEEQGSENSQLEPDGIVVVPKVCPYIDHPVVGLGGFSR